MLKTGTFISTSVLDKKHFIGQFTVHIFLSSVPILRFLFVFCGFDAPNTWVWPGIYLISRLFKNTLKVNLYFRSWAITSTGHLEIANPLFE